MQGEERFEELTADLVESEENSVFLERLFSLKAGAWEDVTALCRDIVQLEDDMAQLQRSSKGGLRATWLNYPASTHGKGYCLIIFFVEELQRRYGTSEPTPWRRTTRPVWSGACQAVKLGSVDKIVPPAEVAATVLTLVER